MATAAGSVGSAFTQHMVCRCRIVEGNSERGTIEITVTPFKSKADVPADFTNLKGEVFIMGMDKFGRIIWPEKGPVWESAEQIFLSFPEYPIEIGDSWFLPRRDLHMREEKLYTKVRLNGRDRQNEDCVILAFETSIGEPAMDGSTDIGFGTVTFNCKESWVRDVQYNSKYQENILVPELKGRALPGRVMMNVDIMRLFLEQA